METQHLKQRENETGKEKVDNLFIFFFIKHSYLICFYYFTRVYLFVAFGTSLTPPKNLLFFFYIPLTTILSLGDLDDKLSRSFLDYYY